jgi:hypothetical protein
MATVRAKVKLKTVNSNRNNLKPKPALMARNQIQTDPVLLHLQTISSRRVLTVLLIQMILHVNNSQICGNSRHAQMVRLLIQTVIVPLPLPVTIPLHHHNSNAPMV